MVGQIGICHRALPQDMALKRQVTRMAAGLRKAGSATIIRCPCAGHSYARDKSTTALPHAQNGFTCNGVYEHERVQEFWLTVVR